MKTSTLYTFLFVVLTLLACADDEHTSNIPPDLRLEDVVGCWFRNVQKHCVIKCFDTHHMQIYRDYDSLQMRSYESIGSFAISHFRVTQRAVGRSEGSEVITDTIEGYGFYKRVDKYLYTLDDRYQLATRYDPVLNLDSLPCGKPFTLLPKPANWTLF